MDDSLDERRAAKILADLLAVILSESEPQAISGLAAIRRRADSDGVTGGTIKGLVARLLETRVQPGNGRALAGGWTDPQTELERLRVLLAGQQGDLADTLHARHQTETALSELQATNGALSDRIGSLRNARRNGWVLGFVLGVASAGVALGVIVGAPALLRHGQRAAMSSAATRALQEAVGACFVRSTNSLGGGMPFDVRLVLQLDAQGRITAADVAPDQLPQLTDGQRRFADLLLRTLRGGSCGALPLPPELRGKAGPLPLFLPQ